MSRAGWSSSGTGRCWRCWTGRRSARWRSGTECRGSRCMRGRPGMSRPGRHADLGAAAAGGAGGGAAAGAGLGRHRRRRWRGPGPAAGRARSFPRDPVRGQRRGAGTSAVQAADCRRRAGDTCYGELFNVGWPDAPHRALRNRLVQERGPRAGRRRGSGRGKGPRSAPSSRARGRRRTGPGTRWASRGQTSMAISIARRCGRASPGFVNLIQYSRAADTSSRWCRGRSPGGNRARTSCTRAV
jgi:hypothetical protein